MLTIIFSKHEVYHAFLTTTSLTDEHKTVSLDKMENINISPKEYIKLHGESN